MATIFVPQASRACTRVLYKVFSTILLLVKWFLPEWSQGLWVFLRCCKCCILNASHPLERVRNKVEKLSESSAVRNIHRHAQAQAIDNSRWLSTTSQCDRPRVNIDWGRLSLSTVDSQLSISSNSCFDRRSTTNPIVTQLILVCRWAGQGLSTIAAILDYKLISNWDLEGFLNLSF